MTTIKIPKTVPSRTLIAFSTDFEIHTVEFTKQNLTIYMNQSSSTSSAAASTLLYKSSMQILAFDIQVERLRKPNLTESTCSKWKDPPGAVSIEGKVLKNLTNF